MIVLHFQLFRRHGFTAKQFRSLKQEALEEAAHTWQREFLERHFSTSGRNIYGYESRHPFYRDVGKKQEGTGKGKTAMLVLSGRSERAARHLATITASSRRAVIRMSLPRYFTHPFVGVITDPQTLKRRVIKHQPDKVEELTTVTQDESRRLARSARDDLVRRVTALNQPLTV